MTDTPRKTENLDLLWGAAEIAAALNMKSPRQAQWFLESGQLPARKVGRLWVASRKALKDHFEGVQHDRQS